MKPHTGIASISTDSVTQSASSGSDAAMSPASRSNEVSARLRLAERREKLRMLARHGSGDSSNHDADGGKKGKARPVIHVSRGSRLVRKVAASANEDRRRRRSWSPENHANRHCSHGRRQRSPARASRDRGGSRPRRHGELKRSESSGRLERARKPSSMEPRGPSRLSQAGHSERVVLGRERVLQRSASFDDRGSRLQRSSSMPETSATTNDRRPRAAFERNRNHESKERPSRVEKATERRSMSACDRDRDRQVNRNAASLVKNQANRPVSRRKSSGQSKPSSREADKRRILQQSRKFNADSEKRAQVRPMDNGTQRSKPAHALNDPRAVEKVTHFRDKTKVAASSNLKSDTDRTNEALRQANLTLLSSQLTKFNFKSQDDEEGKALSSSLNGKALVPVPPLAPARRIGRVQSSNRNADEKNNHKVIPVLKGEMRQSRSNDIIDVYKKGIHGEANEKIAPSSDKGHISRAGDKIVAQDKRPERDEKETRFVRQEEKVHKSSAMDKFEADEVLNHDFDDDDNVSIDVCLDTSHLETAGQLDRRVSSLTLRESDWKLDLTSSLVKFDDSNNTTVQDVALIERGTSPAATGEGFTHESGQASNTNEDGIPTSNIENYHKDIVHFQEKTADWQQQATNDESIDVIEIDDLDDSIIYSSQKKSKHLRRRLSSMNDSSVTDGASILEAVPQVNNMSFRDLANQLTGRKTKAADVSHIDAESTSSFFADVSPPVKKKQVDHHIRNEKVDEIIQQISKCREKSFRIIQEPLQQAGHIGDAKKMVSLTATTNKHVSQKFPPPPPRRTNQITCIANQQPNVVPSPPARNSQLVRLPQDGSIGTPLSPSHTKAKISSPRPPPPPMPTYKKHASTGTAIRQTSPQEFHHGAQAPPAPPLYARNASTGNPKVDAASHSTQRSDPVDHLLSQLQHVDGMSPGNPKGFRRSTSGGSVKNDQDQAASNNLRRRNSTGVLRNANHATNNTQSGEVSNMPYRDTIGGRYGVYSGQVDQWGRPHGQGKILYTTGVLFEGKWINGVPCQAVPPFQPGPVSNLNGTTGDLTHYYCMTPSVYGAMPPSTYYNTSQLNMSMNSFNNSMNWDYR